MRVAVTGSSGFIGSALRAELLRCGHEPVPIVRQPDQGDSIYWNIQAGTIDRDKLSSVDTVVHLAGESIARRWTGRQKARIVESRVQGTTLLARTLAELSTRPATLISASAIGYYGDRDDEVLDEEAPPGSGYLPDVCVQWERSATPAREAGIRVVHPRIGLVLSADGGALTKMLLPFRMGVGGRVGSGRQYWSWITLDDLVQVFVFILENPSLAGAVNATAPHPVTNREFTRALGRALHRPTALPLPAFAARSMLGEMADGLLLASARVLPTRLQTAGYTFLHPDLDEALQSVL